MDESDRAAIYRLHAGFCKTLADANRLLIISELDKSELPVGELARRLNLAQPNVSKHLALLREQGLVAPRREGANTYYRLTDHRISEAIRLLKEVQAEQIEKRMSLASGGREAPSRA